MSFLRTVLPVVIVGLLLAGCSSNAERMTDPRQPMAKDRAECNLSRGSGSAGSGFEQPPSWCRDDEEILQWSTNDEDDDMEVDFTRKKGYGDD